MLVLVISPLMVSRSLIRSALWGGVERVGLGERFGYEVGVVGVEVAECGEYDRVDVVGGQARGVAFLAAVAGAGKAGVVAAGFRPAFC